MISLRVSGVQNRIRMAGAAAGGLADSGWRRRHEHEMNEDVDPDDA